MHFSIYGIHQVEKYPSRKLLNTPMKNRLPLCRLNSFKNMASVFQKAIIYLRNVESPSMATKKRLNALGS